MISSATLVERLRTAASNNRIQAERRSDAARHPLMSHQIIGKQATADLHATAADHIEQLAAEIAALRQEPGKQ